MVIKSVFNRKLLLGYTLITFVISCQQKELTPVSDILDLSDPSVTVDRCLLIGTENTEEVDILYPEHLKFQRDSFIHKTNYTQESIYTLGYSHDRGKSSIIRNRYGDSIDHVFVYFSFGTIDEFPIVDEWIPSSMQFENDRLTRIFEYLGPLVAGIKSFTYVGNLLQSYKYTPYKYTGEIGASDSVAVTYDLGNNNISTLTFFDQLTDSFTGLPIDGYKEKWTIKMEHDSNPNPFHNLLPYGSSRTRPLNAISYFNQNNIIAEHHIGPLGDTVTLEYDFQYNENDLPVSIQFANSYKPESSGPTYFLEYKCPD